MRQKTFLKAGLFLLLISLFYSCEKDLYEEALIPANGKVKADVMHLSDVKWINPNAYEAYSKIHLKSTRPKSSTAKEMYGVDVDTTKILYLEKEDGYKSFTFTVKQEEEAQHYLKNLIISIKPDGEMYAFLAKYDLNKALEEVNQQQIKDEINNLEFFRISLTTYDYRDEICISIGTWVSVPKCEGELVTPEESPRCFNSDGTRAYITVFIGTTACSGGGGGPSPIGPDPHPPVPPTNPGPPSPGNLGGGDGTHTGTGTSPGSTGTNPDGNNPDPTENQPITTAPWMEGDDGPDPPTPCDQLNDLTKTTNANIKPNIDWLKTKLNGPNVVENGVEFSKGLDPATGDPVYTNNNIVSANNANVPIMTGGNHYGGAHTHPNNGHPMLSFGDLVVLRDLYQNAKPSSKTEVTFILVCKTSIVPYTIKTYAIKVDDINSLISEINLRLSNPAYSSLPTEDDKVNAEVKRQAGIYDKCNGEYEKSFLQQFGSFGISLYKADDYVDNWKKLDLGTNPDPTAPNQLIVTEAPCN
jgi:hypothetical protein